MLGTTITRWYPTVQWLDGRGVADLLRTTSLYRRLEPDVREPLLDAVAERSDGPIALETAQAATLLQACSRTPIRDACLSWSDEAAWWLWLDLIVVAPVAWLSAPALLAGGVALAWDDAEAAALALSLALAADPDNSMALLLRSGLDLVPARDVADGLRSEPSAYRNRHPELATILDGVELDTRRVRQMQADGSSSGCRA